ncbi:MAG TPA: hypothetical protein VFT75_00635 [Nocardioidaceae bacterium]|nr:hypothetical protein [Nocardioidaceae bacterium]
MMSPLPMLLTQYWKADLELRRERAGAGTRSPATGRRKSPVARPWARRPAVA